MVSRVHCRDRGCARERESEGLGDSGHRRGGTHRHALTRRACHRGFERVPLGLADDPGALFVPEAPHVRSAAQCLAVPVTCEHRAGRHVDDGPVRACGAHQERRCGLVAAAHEHGTVEWVRAEYLLGVHREQVSVQHGRRLLECLREGGHRHLDRIPTGLPDAALYCLGALAQVHVAGVDVAPGIENPDDGLVGQLLGTNAELAGT